MSAKSKPLQVLFLHNLQGEGPIPSRLKAVASCYGVKLLLPDWEGNRPGEVRTCLKKADAVLAVATSALHIPTVVDGLGVVALSRPTLFLLERRIPEATRQEIKFLLGISVTEFDRAKLAGIELQVVRRAQEDPRQCGRTLEALAHVVLGLLSLQRDPE